MVMKTDNAIIEVK